jgi:hypothetical protein
MGWADRHLRPAPTKKFRAERSPIDWPRQEFGQTSNGGANPVFSLFARLRTKSQGQIQKENSQPREFYLIWQTFFIPELLLR